MLLSIVSVFCDNDYKMIPALISNIKEKVHVPYEIILIDNREQFKNDDPGNIDDAHIYSKGYNTYQFEARRFAVQYCNGDYIWFIDSDDTILSVKSDLNFTEDLILFNHANYTNLISLPPTWYFKKQVLDTKQRFISIKRTQLDSYIVNHDPFTTCCCTLWNKWIKKDLVSSIIKDIPESLEIVASEDVLYSALFIDRSKTICFCNDTIYLYREDLSKGFNSKITTDRFFHIIKGRKLSRKLFRRCFDNPEYWDNTDVSAAYFVYKAFFTSDAEICLKEMLNHFSIEEISKVQNHIWLEPLSQNQKETLSKFIAEQNL